MYNFNLLHLEHIRTHYKGFSRESTHDTKQQGTHVGFSLFDLHLHQFSVLLRSSTLLSCNASNPVRDGYPVKSSEVAPTWVSTSVGHI